MPKHYWKVASEFLKDGTEVFYCYWSDENDRKYSTWYYYPFKSRKTAYKWIREINFGLIPFSTTSLTKTKYYDYERNE